MMEGARRSSQMVRERIALLHAACPPSRPPTRPPGEDDDDGTEWKDRGHRGEAENDPAPGHGAPTKRQRKRRAQKAMQKLKAALEAARASLWAFEHSSSICDDDADVSADDCDTPEIWWREFKELMHRASASISEFEDQFLSTADCEEEQETLVNGASDMSQAKPCIPQPSEHASNATGTEEENLLANGDGIDSKDLPADTMLVFSGSGARRPTKCNVSISSENGRPPPSFDVGDQSMLPHDLERSGEKDPDDGETVAGANREEAAERATRNGVSHAGCHERSEQGTIKDASSPSDRADPDGTRRQRRMVLETMLIIAAILAACTVAVPLAMDRTKSKQSSGVRNRNDADASAQTPAMPTTHSVHRAPTSIPEREASNDEDQQDTAAPSMQQSTPNPTAPAAQPSLIASAGAFYGKDGSFSGTSTTGPTDEDVMQPTSGAPSRPPLTNLPTAGTAGPSLSPTAPLPTESPTTAGPTPSPTAAQITSNVILRLETLLTQTQPFPWAHGGNAGDGGNVGAVFRRIDDFVENCVANDILGVSVELKRSDVNMDVPSPQLGHLYFDSSHANTAVYTGKGYTEYFLFRLLSKLRAEGIKTYAWWPTFNDAVLARANPADALHTRQDFGSTDPSDLIASDQFVSVHSDAVRQHQLDMLNEILTHPSMSGWDGVRLDYIRFDHDEDDFSEAARMRYIELHGSDPLTTVSSIFDEPWKSFRKDEITTFLQEATTQCHNVDPNLDVGGYVLPFPAHPGGFDLYQGQGNDFTQYHPFGFRILPMIYWQDWASSSNFASWTKEKVFYSVQYSNDSPPVWPILSIATTLWCGNDETCHRQHIMEAFLTAANSGKDTVGYGSRTVEIFYYNEWGKVEWDRLSYALSTANEIISTGTAVPSPSPDQNFVES